jgi:hypothetical protein
MQQSLFDGPALPQLATLSRIQEMLSPAWLTLAVSGTALLLALAALVVALLR